MTFTLLWFQTDRRDYLFSPILTFFSFNLSPVCFWVELMPDDDADASFGGCSRPHYALLRCHSVRLLTPVWSVLLSANKAQLSLDGSQVELVAPRWSSQRETHPLSEARLGKMKVKGSNSCRLWGRRVQRWSVWWIMNERRRGEIPVRGLHVGRAASWMQTLSIRSPSHLPLALKTYS